MEVASRSASTWFPSNRWVFLAKNCGSTFLLGTATLDTLKKWANRLCQRVTYLLENLGPLEFDAHENQVLIRSTPPDNSAAGTTKYYEVMLSSHGAGRFSLRRFRNDSAGSGRVPVPLQLTHEQLSKLVNDLVATIPATP